MSTLRCNKKGITLIESVIAIMLVSIGLVGLMSMQPSAWQASTRTDYLGRGAMTLNRELSRQELWIMNPCNAVATGTVTRTVNTSDQGTAQAGDINFTVTTTTTNIATNVWRVTVRVSWLPLNPTGITESMVVTRQENFRFPSGCV
jgi:Tfp pilus assembly protein PilV